MKYLIILLILSAISTNAEIITDGTLGQQVNLSGSNFQITSDLGQRYGNNLFHSFQIFNLNSSETATFSGSNSIQNIISRITGGNPSNIDGLISSTIPNADFYFFNPYGIIFGPNAKLDVQGSFHASTADYLRLGKNGQFNARNPSNSILTVASVETFGFLGNSVAPISIQGKGSINQIDQAGLIVSAGKTLSLIGGDIKISNGSFTDSIEVDESEHGFASESGQAINLPDIAAPSGRINLVTVASQGEVKLGKDFIDISSFAKLANLFITNNSMIQTSGKAGGSIFIRSQLFNLYDSIVEGNTLGIKNGGIINIQVEHLIAEESAEISAQAISSGKSGSIDITANQMELYEGAIVTTEATGIGEGGNIFIKVAETLGIYGQSSTGFASNITASSASVGLNTGDAGYINIQAGNLFLTDGGAINNVTFGDGKGGDIILNINNTLMLSDGFDVPRPGFTEIGMPELELLPSIIMAGTVAGNGDGGNIYITARNIILNNGGQIAGDTYTFGNAGFLDIKVMEDLVIEGYYSGKIIFNSGISSSTILMENAGNAGSISIQANKIYINNNGEITTIADNATGGNINIKTAKLLYFNEGMITTSVHGGKGNGGNISIENPTFIIMDDSKITAQADEGHGGNINIKSEQFISSPDSLINASSELGLDGKIQIDSFNVDIEGFLVILSDNIVEASKLMKRPCSMRGSSFVVHKINGSSQTPYDYQAVHYLLKDKIVTSLKKLDKKLVLNSCKKINDLN
ncbi:MAG TPA: filamentous hemagglutinin N-terminal domain-containing protein [Thioploca sp.]|nr:filamentous hemagglutinin N-terminal domain-containing protein [Thioploca sp.]